CVVVEDSQDLSITQTVDILQLAAKIRTTTRDCWVSSAKESLIRNLSVAVASCHEIHIVRPDGSEPDIFEQYFSARLVMACIKGDLKGVKELIQTNLATVLLESKLSGKNHPRAEWELLFLTFRPIHWAAI